MSKNKCVKCKGLVVFGYIIDYDGNILRVFRCVNCGWIKIID
jgi:hypothetical protein